MKKMKEILPAVLAWLLLWQILSAAVNNIILLAGPLETLAALFRLASETDFWLSCAGSVIRIAGGFLAGSAAGILLAAGAYRSRGFRIFLQPFVTAVKAVPVASFVILVLIWAGNSGIAFWVSLLVVFPVLYLNTLNGLRSADGHLLEAARVFGLTLPARVRAVFLPALKPFFQSGFSIAAGMSFKAGTAAEVIGQPLYSLGNGMYRAKIWLETADVLAWTLTVVLLSWAAEQGIRIVLKKIPG